MQELSDADRCRKKGWVVGTIIKAKSRFGLDYDRHFEITAIGRELVLVLEVKLPERTTSGEHVLNMYDIEYTYRKVTE